MQYGLRQQTLASILNIFAEHPNIERAILYGSRAKGNYRPGSDIDITLVGEQLNQTELFAVMEQLEQLDLPYEFDLSLYAQIENTNFIEHIERVGQVIYQRL